MSRVWFVLSKSFSSTLPFTNRQRFVFMMKGCSSHYGWDSTVPETMIAGELSVPPSWKGVSFWKLMFSSFSSTFLSVPQWNRTWNPNSYINIYSVLYASFHLGFPRKHGVTGDWISPPLSRSSCSWCTKQCKEARRHRGIIPLATGDGKTSH